MLDRQQGEFLQGGIIFFSGPKSDTILASLHYRLNVLRGVAFTVPSPLLQIG